MDREEAILIIGEHKKNAERLAGKTLAGQKSAEAFNMAIEALSAEPCEDTISRQAVLDYIDKMPSELTLDGRRVVRRRTLEEYISDTLPSVTPKQKMGRWIKEKKHHKDDFQEFDYLDVRCSECGARKRIGWTNIRHCPMCGVKMEESK